jgi:hypothetical protein
MSRALLDSLELPHWLILAGILLLIAGVVGLVIDRKRLQKVDAPNENSEANENSEPRPQLPRYRTFSTPGRDENGVRLRPMETWRRSGSANDRAGHRKRRSLAGSHQALRY